MNREDIEKVIRFRETHNLRWSRENLDEDFTRSIEVSNPDGLLPKSRAHQDEEIKYWTDEIWKNFSQIFCMSLIMKNKDLDNLAWALKFMQDYERKHKISVRYSG